MRAELRRARYGYRLALHLLLLCAAGRTPSEVAVVLFCSRSSVYRIVQAYLASSLTFDEPTGQGVDQRRLRLLTPSLKRSVLALLKTGPRALGWCRTRWSCATLAVELQVRRGTVVSTEMMRHWLHDLGWEWKRAKVTAKDADPDRVPKLARIRLAVEQLRAGNRECLRLFHCLGGLPGKKLRVHRIRDTHWDTHLCRTATEIFVEAGQ